MAAEQGRVQSLRRQWGVEGWKASSSESPSPVPSHPSFPSSKQLIAGTLPYAFEAEEKQQQQWRGEKKNNSGAVLLPEVILVPTSYRNPPGLAGGSAVDAGRALLGGGTAGWGPPWVRRWEALRERAGAAPWDPARNGWLGARRADRLIKM